MYIALDIGGTNIRIGLFENLNKLTKVDQIPAYPLFDKAQNELIAKLIILLENNPVEGIGVCLPGPQIDKELGAIIKSINLPGWTNKSIKKVLADAFKTKVLVEHDVVCAALGESTTLKDTNKFIFVVWGTGVGGAIAEKVSGKFKIIQAEIGHQIIVIDGNNCPCGQKGCLEAYVGGKSIVRRFGQRLEDIKNPGVWDEIATKMAQGIINLNLLNLTELIVFGGGISVHQPRLVNEVEKIVKKEQKVLELPKFKIATYGQETALYGCMKLFSTTKNSPETDS